MAAACGKPNARTAACARPIRRLLLPRGAHSSRDGSKGPQSLFGGRCDCWWSELRVSQRAWARRLVRNVGWSPESEQKAPLPHTLESLVSDCTVPRRYVVHSGYAYPSVRVHRIRTPRTVPRSYLCGTLGSSCELVLRIRNRACLLATFGHPGPSACGTSLRSSTGSRVYRYSYNILWATTVLSTRHRQAPGPRVHHALPRGHLAAIMSSSPTPRPAREAAWR